MLWRSSLRGTGREPDRSRCCSTVAPESAAALVALGLFAAFLEFHYGRRGYMPLDQSVVVFDGGWRTLSGQIPFRDYTTPNAITPSLLQGLSFWLLGVSWTAYLVHAAVFNALFAALVYLLLRLCDAGRPTAALYAGLSAVVFYPPVGVPFHDQSAFLFVLLAIVLAVAARSAGAECLVATTVVGVSAVDARGGGSEQADAGGARRPGGPDARARAVVGRSAGAVVVGGRNGGERGAPRRDGRP